MEKSGPKHMVTMRKILMFILALGLLIACNDGSTGPKGDRGPQGIQGIMGPKGDKGDPGKDGPQGEKGDRGPMGLNGQDGERGPQGEPGSDGKVGPAGPQGAKGEEGPLGPQGIAGPKGDKGDKGDTGSRGPRGYTGAQGPQGETGPKGKDYIAPTVLWKMEDIPKGKRLSVYDDDNDNGVLDADDFFFESFDFEYGKTVGSQFQNYVRALQYVDMRFEHQEMRDLAQDTVLPGRYFCEIYIGDSLVWKFTAHTKKIGQGVTEN